MTKYKWSLLGLIVSIILFLVFLINPLISFKNSRRFVPVEEIPETIKIELANAEELDSAFKELIQKESAKIGQANIDQKKVAEIEKEVEKSKEMANNDYKEWYRNAPKKFIWSSLNVVWKSFYHWNLFWILIIIFSFMTLNYKKSK